MDFGLVSFLKKQKWNLVSILVLFYTQMSVNKLKFNSNFILCSNVCEFQVLLIFVDNRVIRTIFKNITPKP